MPGAPMRVVQSQSFFEPSMPMPLIQKKNNNKINKNLSINKYKYQNVENEENEDDKEGEEESDSNDDDNNRYGPSARPGSENIPQMINSFYFLNENIKKK